MIDDFISDKLAITHTNGEGRWRFRRDLEPGRYFAKVEARPGCRFDNSRVERLG